MTAKEKADEATNRYVTAKSSATTHCKYWSVPALHIAPSSAQEIAGDDTVTDEPMVYDLDNVIVAPCPTNNGFDDDTIKYFKESLLRIEKHLKVLTREICSLRAQNDAAKLINMQQPDFLSRQDHGFDLPFKGQDEFGEFEHTIHSDEDRKEKIVRKL